MNAVSEIEELREAVRQLRKDQDILMTSLTSFADSVKTALLGTLNRETNLTAEVSEIRQRVAELEARIAKPDRMQ
jgi:hypothetical protein